MDRHDVHEIMDILSAVCTIIVSVVAIWGSISIWSSGLWHKFAHVVDYYHNEITRLEETSQFRL